MKNRKKKTVDNSQINKNLMKFNKKIRTIKIWKCLKKEKL